MMAKHTPPSPAGAYANDADLADHFGVSRATIWRWVTSQGFPQPIKLSPQITRWRWADVRAWEDRRAEAA